MAKKPALGRGLGAIFGEEAKNVNTAANTAKKKPAAASKDKEEEKTVSRETSKIRMSLIEPNPDQPRKNFDNDSLSELADSIKKYGVLQPILLKKKGQMYEIVVGERRWRAAKMAGLKEIPAVVRELESKEAAEIAIIENIQREDLNPVEEAKAFRALIDNYGMTQEALAERLSMSRPAVANVLRLLQLEDKVLEMVSNGELSAGHARALLGISSKRAQYKAAREVVTNSLSVRETERLVKQYNREKKNTDKKAKEDSLSMYLDAIAEQLTESLGTKVNICQQTKKKGKIVIEYYSAEELERITDRLH